MVGKTKKVRAKIMLATDGQGIPLTGITTTEDLLQDGTDMYLPIKVSFI